MGEGGTCGNDSLGNRLTSRLGTATDTYTCPATSNRLSLINLATGGTRGFTYDASGSVTAEARPGGTYGYTYNAAGRMSEFRINGILQASYKYDAMGRQAIRTLSSPTVVTIHSVFDSDGRRIAEYNETSGALIREYVWNAWEPVAVIEGGVISFVRADHIGRPVFATNATGVKTWTATYTPFGGVHTSTGAPPSARFPGQWFQSESGLHQNWMRDYDPTTGRYLQADPLGLVDGASVYGYVKQNPGRWIDPTGLEVAIIWNFPVPGNPFGHCAVAVNGLVWSFGTKHPDGTPYDEYMNDMRKSGRAATVVKLHTSPAQDRAAQDYLEEWSRNKPPYDALSENCANVCQGAMDAADIPTVWAPSALPINAIRRANRYRNSTLVSIPGLE